MAFTHSCPALTAAAGVMVTIVALATPANADPILYTFEAPQFSVGNATPLFNKTPNIGDPTFETDFFALPVAPFIVSPFVPNDLFAGNSLASHIAPEFLTLTFSSPIFSLAVDFAVYVPQESVSRLQLLTPVGSTSQSSANVGGIFPGGTLVFTTPVPFSTAELTGFGAGRIGAVFAIDNLVLNTSPIPEPAPLLLLGTGLLGMGLRLASIATRRDA